MSRLLHELLTESARLYPLREAVVYRKEALLYRDLDELSSALAQLLRRQGVRAGDRVGIFLNKSLEAVISLFGILKSGAAYVPIDPLAPPRRAAFIAADCQMQGLITSPEKARILAQDFPESLRLATLVLTGEEPSEDLPLSRHRIRWAELENERRGLGLGSAIPVQEKDLAYILYTSGSTGRPKGVMISHRASWAFVNWAREFFRIIPEERVSNHAPFHFDLSIFDLFSTLQAGAAVVLVPPELSAFPRELADFIQQENISIWYSVPSVLSRLLFHGGLDRHRFEKLRAVLFAGEVFPVQHMRELQKLIPDAEYFNLYGPTETNVCTAYQVPAIDTAAQKSLPIGQACPYADVFLWSETNRPVQPGEEGEIYIGGDSLMEGYWSLPQKTEELLIPDPRPGSPPERKVYRSGDQAREDASGNLVFLGRLDHMIKSRGYRIELEEVEANLLKHPDIREAVVLAIPDEDIGHALKAVVVCRPQAQVTEADLRVYCAGFLPSYMIPQSFEFCSALPRTSTGKVHREGLLSDVQGKDQNG